MNVYRSALVVVLAFGLALPTLAVNIVLDPGAFTKYGLGTDRESDAYQWWATSINGTGEVRFGRDGGGAYGPQAVSVNAGATVVNLSLENNTILVGSIFLDEDGNVESYTGGLTSYVDDTTGYQAFQFVTHPVTFDLNGYTGGWHIQDVHWDPRSATVWTYSLPATVREGDVYTIRTPGTEAARFTLGTDGKPTVTQPGSAGLVFDDASGALMFTNVVPITYTWACSDESVDVGNLPWYPGWPGGTGGGGDKRGAEGTLGLIPGAAYNIGWYSLDYYNKFGGAWDDQNFAVPDDPTGWSCVLTYRVPDNIETSARVYTLTLAGPAIPEPMTMSLLTLGGLALLRRRR